MAVNVQGLFASWLPTTSVLHLCHPADLLSLSVTQTVVEKKLEEKCKLTPVYWGFSSLFLPGDPPPWLQTLFDILISMLTTGSRTKAHKWGKQRPGWTEEQTGTCSTVGKNPHNNSSSLTPTLINTSTNTRKHTVLGSVFAHVCDKQAGRGRHWVALTDACRKRQSNIPNHPHWLWSGSKRQNCVKQLSSDWIELYWSQTWTWHYCSTWTMQTLQNSYTVITNTLQWPYSYYTVITNTIHDQPQ